MKLSEVTPKHVLKAGRRIFKRKGWFTAKDVWYELGFSRFSKNNPEKNGAVVISNLLRDASIRDYIEKCVSSACGNTRYVIVRRRRK